MNSQQWEAWAEDKYGSLENARAIRRAAAAKSSRNKGKDSGFAKLAREDPEYHKEIARKGGYSRAANLKAQAQQTADDSFEAK